MREFKNIVFLRKEYDEEKKWWKIFFKYKGTPNVEYFFVKSRNDEEMIIEDLEYIDEHFEDGKIFLMYGEIFLPAWINYVGMDIGDQADQVLYSTDIADIVADSYAGTSGGWEGVMLRPKIAEKTLVKILLPEIVKLWDKYAKKVYIDTFAALYPVIEEFSVSDDEIEEIEKEVEGCYIECKRIKIKVKIPRNLYKDIEYILAKYSGKVKKIILESIRKLEELEKKVSDEKQLVKIVSKKIEKRRELLNILSKIHEDELEVI